MVCGQNFHGGNEQPGCGHKFSWQDALSYSEDARSFDAATSDAPVPPRRPHPVIVRGLGAFHPFASCNICGTDGDGIAGLRFRCIHCESFSVCQYCEPVLAKFHDSKHVFEVMYEPDFDWCRVQLPDNMMVRIVRHGEELPSCNLQSLNQELEGKSGQIKRLNPESMIRGSVQHRRAIALGIELEHYNSYLVQLTTAEGIHEVIISAKFLMPQISSDREARQLIEGSFEVRSE